MDWLFGREEAPGWAAIVVARSLDIDIVADVYRVLVERYERIVADAEAMTLPPEQAQDVEAQMAFTHTKATAVQMARETKPRVVLNPLPPRGAPPMIHPTTTVAIEDVPSLNASQRAGIMVEGAGLQVDFRRGVAPMINANLGRPESQDLIPVISRIIAGGGRRRARWARLLRFLPFVFAALATGLGVWMLVSDRSQLPEYLFVATVLVALWIGAVLAYRALATRYAHSWPGHRFREVTRSALRDRITNARATFYVSLFTVPAGAVLGYLLRLWLGNGS